MKTLHHIGASAILLLVSLNVYSQSTIPGNVAGPGAYLGWSTPTVLFFRTNYAAAPAGSGNRMIITNGAFGANDGRIAMGNSLANGFAPQDRLHLHQTAGLTATRYTNGVTGATATDGFQVGIAALGGGIIQHYRPGTPISFGTNNSAAGVAYRMRVYSYADNGFIAIGNVNNFPSPLAALHIMMFTPNMANPALRGNVFRTDGENTVVNAWRMFTGPNTFGSTEKFSVLVPIASSHATLQATNGDLFLNTSGPTSGVQERVHITNGTGNLVGVTQPNATRVNISYGAGYNPITNPVALLNLGFEGSTGPVGGQRNWMDIGTFTCGSSDNMYVGLKNEAPGGAFGPSTTDRMDAVVSWGDNNGSTPPFGPDRLRFIYTQVQNPATPTGAASNEGLETMRMIPVNSTTAYTGIGGDPQINLYSLASVDPGNTLEVNSMGATNAAGGSSGLRFTNLTAASPSTPNVAGGNVLSVDANGDVILVPGGGNTLGGACGNVNNMTADFEIPMNNFNYVFTGQGTGTNSVAIGMPAGACTPLPAKLTVNENVLTLNSIGVLARNSSPNSCSVMALNTGVGGVPGNPQVAAWCQAGPDQYALVVPKGGGMVSIGRTSTVAGPAFSWFPFTPNFPVALVDVGGSIYMNGSLVLTSDATLKHNVTTITDALDRVLSLRGVTFEWNTAEDSVMAGIHSGFIAQEVDSFIPEVVLTDANGIMSIAYTELIPYLVEALKAEHIRNDSLAQRLDSLSNVVAGCCSSSARQSAGQGMHVTDVTLTNAESVVLNQNVPNPFAEQTSITYYLPESVVKAQILFYDANGKLIKAVDISGRGHGQLNVFADDLSNGIYSYALIADGQVADTKKMVKTE